jgi:hypothetical protein
MDPQPCGSVSRQSDRPPTLAIGNLRTENPAHWGANSTVATLAIRVCGKSFSLSNLETRMKLFSALTILAIAAAGPAFAEGKCTGAPKSKWQPTSALESQLQAGGYKVRQIKVEGGCYEVYATDKDGKRANMAFNAETLQKLDNAEAGEN